MQCPKCEEGIIERIIFKKNKENGFLCDFCGAVWLEGENISMNTGHVMQSFTKDDDMEYTFSDSDEEPKSVMQTH